ncbi:MAG: VWA domain-containing protein [Tenericutes bacterium]|nr:VWA domain-containing protein [Mycoplasmatota bacterium]
MKKLMFIFLLTIGLFLVGCSESMEYSTTMLAYNIAIEAESNEEYADISENKFISVSDMPVSTFSADVDTAAYSIIRKKLMQDELPNRNAVRIEEMLNYFTYDLDTPIGNEVIHVTKELSDAPWNEDHQLLMLGLKTEDIIYENAIPSNLVFLLDVSGSMNSADKLPLLKQAIILLVGELRASDRISLVVYAGSAGVVLDGADGSDKESIIDAINSLEAGGSTAGGEGINLAYNVAATNYIEGGNNRVILATDGDFNVGVSSDAALERLITQKKESGIFLSVCGFGTGNLKDSKMETLADKGNGVYYYIDNLLEAKKVFVEEMGGTLLTVAKDVKLQVEFNPALVKGYRLIGYENRILDYNDFNNDEVDAGDIGAGHEVIVLYEIIPFGSDEVIDEATYEIPETLKYDGENYLDQMLTLSIRYKAPDSDVSEKKDYVVYDSDFTETPSDNFLFASSVAEFGMLLLDSEFKYNSSYNAVIARATDVYNDDYKEEFIELVRIAQRLQD